MRIEAVPEGFTIKDVVSGLADSLKLDNFEFVIYLPGTDGYENPPQLRATYEAEYVRRIELETIRREMVGSLGRLERSEEEYALGLSSLVFAGDVQFHTPQIDFVLQTSEINLNEIYRYLEEIKQTEGYIVESGNSYHFQGVDIMPYTAWTNYMDSLDDNLVDGHWIDSNLIDRHFSVLRLTSAFGKPQTPRVISRIYSK